MALFKATALIGTLPLEIVKTISHTLGNVAVGHSVGTGVRNIQSRAERPLERIQMRCKLMGRNKYLHKFELEAMYASGIPTWFIAKITSLPLCLIDDLTFTQDSGSKDIDDNEANIEFVMTLVEYRVTSFFKLAAKFAWLAWTTATYPDRATGEKLYPTPPTAEQEAAKIVSEFITSTAAKQFDESEVEEYNWDQVDLAVINLLNSRFSKIPIDENGVFPQVIKLIYPPSESYADEFNSFNVDLPDGYLEMARSSKTDDFYAFPKYNVYQTKTIIIKIVPKMINGVINTTLIVEIEDNKIFERKIVPNKIYNVHDYQIVFNYIDIKEGNIQPQNQKGGDYGTKLIGGIRLK